MPRRFFSVSSLIWPRANGQIRSWGSDGMESPAPEKKLSLSSEPGSIGSNNRQVISSVSTQNSVDLNEKLRRRKLVKKQKAFFLFYFSENFLSSKQKGSSLAADLASQQQRTNSRAPCLPPPSDPSDLHVIQ